MGYVPIDQTLVDQQTEAAKQMIEDCKAYGKTVDYQKSKESSLMVLLENQWQSTYQKNMRSI